MFSREQGLLAVAVACDEEEAERNAKE